jgi:tetratricopeptide (TPR) repeat protein
VYRQGLETQVLMENKVLSPYTYHNAVQLALKVQDFDWAKNFMADFRQYLPAKERESISRHVLAIYYFRKNDFAQAMRLFQEGTPKDSLFNLDARRLLARIYYDLKEFSALDSHIESSKIYLHRQKEIGYGKEAYVNFFKVLERIYRNEGATAASRDTLRAEINDMKLLAEREWLLEKLK